MRTTLTIEPSVARQLSAFMSQRKITLKAAINEALREGIPRVAARDARCAPFVVVPFTLRLKPGIDPDRIGHYADDLDDAEKLRKSAL